MAKRLENTTAEYNKGLHSNATFKFVLIVVEASLGGHLTEGLLVLGWEIYGGVEGGTWGAWDLEQTGMSVGYNDVSSSF